MNSVLICLFRLEKLIYFLLWILAVTHSIYCFTSSSYKFFQNYNDEYGDLVNGLSFLSRKRDGADFEWESINYFITHFYPWILLYILVSEIIRNLLINVKVLQYWQIIITLLYIQVTAGYIFVLIILVQPIFFFIICNKYHNKIRVWLCSYISLALITFYKKVNESEEFLKYVNLNEYESYLITVSSCWINLKCISYYLEEQSCRNLSDFLSYCLYPPTVFTGPFILYEDYQNIYKLDSHLRLQHRIKKFVLNTTRCLFWFIFGNICLHYIYVNSTSFQPKLVRTFGNWSLFGYGYSMGQFFHIKYIVLYGLSTAAASFENVNVPHLPRCIGRVHLYSDMWKYFDCGLYKFLLRHIYIPFMRLTEMQLLASLLCFLFIYIWHGIENYILIWTAMNYFGITMEYIFNCASKKYFKNWHREKIRSLWLRRTECLLASPLLIISAVSNFYFFAGIEIGNIFAIRILSDKLIYNVALLFVLYCCCQVSTELRSTNAAKM